MPTVDAPIASVSSPVQPTAALDSVRLLGMRIDRVDMSTAMRLVEGYIESGEPHQIVTADASMIVTASEDAEFADLVEHTDLVTPDGAGILWATRRLGIPLRAKVSGVDLAAQCCVEAPVKGWRLYFFGAGPGVAEAAARRMAEKHPGLVVAGYRDGFFKPEDEARIVDDIRAARPDILFVALGIPKQEKFILRHKAALGVPVCIGVGGTLDVFSGTVKRAPVWMQNAGLEWLYRIGSNPRKRLSKAKALPRFAMMALRARKA